MIKEIFSRLRAFRWQKLLIIWAVFVAMAAILFAERSGIQYEATKFQINYLPRTEAKPAQIAMFGQPVTCLLLYDSGQEGTDNAKEQFDQILLDMKVSTQAVDVHTTSLADIPEFDRYKTVVVLMSDLDPLGKRLLDLMDWVRDGGSVLFAMAPQKTTYFDVISPKLGILSSSWENKIAESIVPTEEFMLGGGQRYELSDPFESSLSVSLREEATVYARTGDEGVPLVWGTKSGAGRVVVDNIGVYDKIMRGIYAASFSLLCDAAAYPVINSSVFYLDDFPSPVPGGDGTYIRRDYRMSIADFYSKVWWPDLVKLAQQYSIRFTGVMIENYEDDTQSAPDRQLDTQQFRYYGSLLLQQGGEVGFHGYNHQPLVLPDTDYKDLYSYRQWPSEDAIVAAMNELIDFQKTVLPNTEGSVYVPPSNILSAAGRKVLGSTVTQIRTITEQYIWQMPDMEHLPLTRTQYNTVAQALPEEIEENYQQYPEGYYYPMPFYIGTPSLQNGVLQLSWDPSYDFNAEDIVYTVELARDYQFRQVLYRQEHVVLPVAQAESPGAGQYFIRVRATNASGYTQDAFDYYVIDTGKVYGVKCFYIQPDGTVVEDIYEE